MRFLAFFLLCFSFFLPLAHALELRVALGVQDLVPNVAGKPGETGGLVAFNEDLAREICRRMNAHCRFSYGIFASILPDVEAHRADLGFGNFLRTPERERRVNFSDSIWRSSSRLLATAATARRYADHPEGEMTLDKLRGVRVAVIADTQQAIYLRSVAAEQQLSLVETKTMADTLRLLRDGKADFSLLTMLSAFVMLSRETPGAFEFVGPAIAERDLGGTVHIALTKGNAALRPAVNRAIAAMRADGTWLRIVRRHFPFNLD